MCSKNGWTTEAALLKSEAKREAIDMKMMFHSQANYIKLVFTRKFCTQPRFESESFWNSEMAH